MNDYRIVFTTDRQYAVRTRDGRAVGVFGTVAEAQAEVARLTGGALVDPARLAGDALAEITWIRAGLAPAPPATFAEQTARAVQFAAEWERTKREPGFAALRQQYGEVR